MQTHRLDKKCDENLYMHTETHENDEIIILRRSLNTKKENPLIFISYMKNDF